MAIIGRNTTNLVQLSDGVLVEVQVSEMRASSSISGKFAEKVKSSFDRINPLIEKVSDEVYSSFAHLERRRRPARTEAEFGVSFDEEGSVYITKSKTDSNISIKLIWEIPQEQQ